jgi:hypothetical protein
MIALAAYHFLHDIRYMCCEDLDFCWAERIPFEKDPDVRKVPSTQYKHEPLLLCHLGDHAEATMGTQGTCDMSLIATSSLVSTA